MGDAHLRKTPPRNRTDAFFETQSRKLFEVFGIAKEESCHAILQPGDLWDAFSPPKDLIAWYIKEFRRRLTGTPFLTILGQHDLQMHSLGVWKGSATNVMQAAECVCLVGLPDPSAPAAFDFEKHVSVYGCSFGQDTIPVPRLRGFNVLLIHAMIGPEALYPDQQIALPGDVLDEMSGYDLIVCGDYHYTFVAEANGRTIVNAGCLVRKTIAQRDREHRPCVFVYDTEKRHLSPPIFLQADPPEAVFREEPIAARGSADNDKLRQLIETLKAKKAITVGFYQTLMRILQETDAKIAGGVQKYIETKWEEISAKSRKGEA